MIPLETPLSALPHAQRFAPKLKKLHIATVGDLLRYFPVRYEDFSTIRPIADLEPGEMVTVQGTVEEAKSRHSWQRRMTIVEAIVADESGAIRATWFNQPYLRDLFRPGRLVNLSGKVSLSEKGELYLAHPTHEFIDSAHAAMTKHTGRLVPVYGETKGLTSKGIRFLVEPLLSRVTAEEWLPEAARTLRDFPELSEAYHAIHFPSSLEEAERARQRFAFEELFLLQLTNLKEKLALAKTKALSLQTDIEWLKTILAGLPFTLTESQKKALWEIIKDIAAPHPMNRLLQGDVGSGKTVVAALASVITTRNGAQAALMAPTELLARQHFETIAKLFRKIPAKDQPIVGLLTAGGAEVLYEIDLASKVSRNELLQKIKRGEAGIVIGTHALIQKGVVFKNLGLVIVDEQHRFGVRQRARLLTQNNADDTQINADDDFLYPDLTYKIRGAFFAVWNTLGSGLKESIYENALRLEFKNQGIAFEEQKTVAVAYRGERVGVYRPDFIIDGKVLVEIKAIPFLGKIEERQIWTYLKGSKYKLGLLANFSSKELQIKRVVLDTARNLRKSAPGVPHFLSMSATPIPRTLMLTIFGDLDVSLIQQLPAGRKKIVTKVVPPAERAKAYAFIREQVKEGRQVFVVCPRIAEAQIDADEARISADRIGVDQRAYQRQSAMLDAKSVTEEYEKLSKTVFPDLRIAMLHGKMKSAEKEKIMADFQSGKSDVLVSTSVVEVGVDVPNAAIMMIESSDRFGLAQLYQFRGRVGRGAHQSYCFLMTESDAKNANARLKAIVEAKNGFELAEYDLKLRGPGQFLGESQTGLPDVAMQSLQNPELVKDSREAAVVVLAKDPLLLKQPLLKKKLAEAAVRIHGE